MIRLTTTMLTDFSKMTVSSFCDKYNLTSAQVRDIANRHPVTIDESDQEEKNQIAYIQGSLSKTGECPYGIRQERSWWFAGYYENNISKD